MPEDERTRSREVDSEAHQRHRGDLSLEQLQQVNAARRDRLVASEYARERARLRKAIERLRLRNLRNDARREMAAQITPQVTTLAGLDLSQAHGSFVASALLAADIS
jgi:hypothetical protein